MTSFSAGILLWGTVLFPPAGRILLPATGFAAYWLMGAREAKVHRLDAVARDMEAYTAPAEGFPELPPGAAPKFVQPRAVEGSAPTEREPSPRPAPPSDEGAGP